MGFFSFYFLYLWFVFIVSFLRVISCTAYSCSSDKKEIGAIVLCAHSIIYGANSVIVLVGA